MAVACNTNARTANDATASRDSGSASDAAEFDGPTRDAPIAIDAPVSLDATNDGASAADAEPPPPDNCGEVTEIVLDGSGLGTIAGSFGQLTHDYPTATSCPQQSPGPDAVYGLQLPAGIYDVTIDTFGSSANTILGIGVNCSASGLMQVCNDDADAVGPSRIWLHRAAGPAQFYILVSSLSSAESGDFQLNVHRQPAKPDMCVSVGGTPLDITGGGTVVGFQQAASGTNRGTCMSASDFSGESIFKWTTASSGTATFTATSSDFLPDLYVRQAVCGTGTEVACQLGGSTTSTISVNTTASTTYYTFVDGGMGTFSLHYQP